MRVSEVMSLCQSDMLHIELGILSIAKSDSNAAWFLFKLEAFEALHICVSVCVFCVCEREIQFTFSCKQAIVLNFGMHYSKSTLADKFFSIHIWENTIQNFTTVLTDNRAYNTAACYTITECESIKNYRQDCKMPWHLLCICHLTYSVTKPRPIWIMGFENVVFTQNLQIL